ncbi:MAG: hypothetical protein IJF02_03850 [Oscillospiraceae bacterium]|nr:hypothetical protein [Oscillospiraceae bacterium]
MASVHHFRTAFRGFNREDVVQYIEYMNNQHNAKIEKLNEQLAAAQAQSADPELLARLEAAEARCAQLEAQLGAENAPVTTSEEELEAYCRAERTERLARERAQQIYTQANAVLADVTVKAESASNQISAIADQVHAQLEQYQQSVSATKDAFQEAVATLYTIRPEE